MTYYGAKELAKSFRTVRKNTLTIAEEIGEEHYGFQASPDARKVAQILTHIALTSRLSLHIHGTEHLSTLEGFDFMGFFGKLMAEEQTAREEGDRRAARRGRRPLRRLAGEPDGRKSG